MDRRKILKLSAASLGFAVTGGALTALMSGCKADSSDSWTPQALQKEEFDLLSEIAEIILPKTDTPGAKEALADRYIDKAVALYLNEEQKLEFFNSLSYFQSLVKESPFESISEASAREKFDLVNLAAIASEGNYDHPFNYLKSLIIPAYFKSELVATKVLHYDPVPGTFKGCVPLSEVGGTLSAL